MANEIQYRDTETGETLYAVIHNGAGQYWDTTGTPAFETLVPGSWGDYDIATTETPASSYHYVGTWPATMSAGTYTLLVFKQGGASVAISDVLLGVSEIYWTGSAVAYFTDTERHEVEVVVHQVDSG